MGQGMTHAMQPEEELRPGTYRIVSGLTGTAIQVSDHDHTKVVAWERHDGESQQWFLQRSGDGYKFKNRRHGTYLAVCSTDIHSLAYAARYPTTWVLLKTDDCYVIQFADNNRVLDLHFGWGTNGNEIHIWPSDGRANKTWKLERVSDDTGVVLPAEFQEEGARLKQDLHDKLDILLHKEQELAVKEKVLFQQKEDIVKMEKELARIRNELHNKDQRISEQHALISQHEETICQLEQDLKSKNEALAHAYKANEETAHLRSQQAHLQTKLSQQQTETASLQTKMDRFEYLMSQMMNKDGRGVGNVH